MKEFNLHILAANRPFYIGPCVSLIVPTPQGKYGIWANHINMIIAVVPGLLLYRLPGQDAQPAAVSHGLVRIENNKVLLLADSVERPEEIDANRAKNAAEEARAEMLHNESIQAHHSAQARLSRALSRLKVKGSYDALQAKTKKKSPLENLDNISSP